MGRKINIFLADDHTLVRSGVRALLSQQADFEIVGEASDGHTVLNALRDVEPDVVLLDISLPGINGLDILDRLRQDFPNIQIVVLSMHNVEEYILWAYQKGASSYITKDAPSDVLIDAIRAAGRRQTYYPPGMSKEKLEEYLSGADGLDPLRLNRLTRREREVLQLLAEGNSTLAIAQKMKISPKTVESHRAHLSEKLEIFDVASLTRYAIQSGLISAG